MSNVLEYQGYYGTVEFSAEDKTLFGKVIGVNSLISFEGDSVQSLRTDFEGAVDDYLAMCAEQGIAPEKAYKGSFNVRLPPELHRALAMHSATRGQTLNAAVEDAIRHYVTQ